MHQLEMAEYARAPGERAVLVVDAGGPRVSGFIELSVRDRVDGTTSLRVGYVEGW